MVGDKVMKRLIFTILLLSFLALGQSITSNPIGVLTIPPISAVSLRTIGVSPTTATAGVGGSQNYFASGTYTDGTTNDITGIATWTSSNHTVATNIGNVFTCNTAGSITVTATYQGVQGTATLVCQSIFISPPTGTIFSINQGSSSISVVQFTASNGTPAYTFSSSDIPVFDSLSLTSGGLLTMTPTTSGTSPIFHVMVTDSLGHTNTGAYQVTVNTSSSEDNRYCNSNDTTNFFPTKDGPATLPVTCINTALANTPVSSDPTYTAFVCPNTQRSSGPSSSFIPGCQVLSATVPGCVQTTGTWYCNSINQVLQKIAAAGPGLNTCGWTVVVYATVDNTATGAQNIYSDAQNSNPPEFQCGTHGSNGPLWNILTTSASSNIPAAGNRIDPAYAGIPSIVGYIPYPNPCGGGIVCVYMPQWKCVQSSQSGCSGTNPQGGIFDANTTLSGFRLIGLDITMAHGRPTATTMDGAPFCQLNFRGLQQCAPGFAGHLFSFQGMTDVILDRDWIHYCDDEVNCYDNGADLLSMNTTSYVAVIDSYLDEATCNNGNGSNCLESHGIVMGNSDAPTADHAIKILNNEIMASSINFFSGGGGSTPPSNATDVEVRRNHFYKPLTWFASPTNYAPPLGNGLWTGYVYDAFIQHPADEGAGYTTTPPCQIEPPSADGGTGITATCHTIVSGGKVVDVIIDNKGSGYLSAPVMSICATPGTGVCIVGQTGGDWIFGGKNGPNCTNQVIPSGDACGVTLVNNVNVKNLVEFKDGVQVLFEGNIAENVWFGQSDQSAYCILMDPRNANRSGNQFDNPNAAATDITVRYNLCRNVLHGVTISVNQAVCSASISKIQTFTCATGAIERISVHDDFFDGLNGWYWNTQSTIVPANIDNGSGGIGVLGNNNPPGTALQSIYINHVTVIGSEPSSPGSLCDPSNISKNCPSGAGMSFTSGCSPFDPPGALLNSAQKPSFIGYTPPLVVQNIPSSVTSFSITGSVITFLGTNNFVPGELLTLSGFSGSTFLNGQVVEVLSSGLSSSQFTVNFSHSNTTGGTGTATPPAGTFSNGQTLRVLLTYNQYLGVESGISVEGSITFSSCGTTCGATVATPVLLPFGYPTYNVYTSIGSTYSELQNNTSGLTDSYTITSVGAGKSWTSGVSVVDGLTIEGSIFSGGVKNIGGLYNGCAQVLSSAGQDVTSTHGPQGGPTTTALNSFATSSLLGTPSGSPPTYPNNIVQGSTVIMNSCVPTACTWPTPTSGQAAACKFTKASSGIGVGAADSPTFTGFGYNDNYVAPCSASGAGAGGSCSSNGWTGCSSGFPTVIALMAGAGNPTGQNGSNKFHGPWCFDHNIMPLAAWPGLNSAFGTKGYPTTQGDSATNNSCDYPAGGLNNLSNTVIGQQAIQTWADVKFVNYATFSDGSECNGVSSPGPNATCPSGDLHLSTISPGYQAASDGKDIGADMDAVLGCNGLGHSCPAGTPSPYTGIIISNGTYIVPW